MTIFKVRLQLKIREMAYWGIFTTKYRHAWPCMQWHRHAGRKSHPDTTWVRISTEAVKQCKVWKIFTL